MRVAIINLNEYSKYRGLLLMYNLTFIENNPSCGIISSLVRDVENQSDMASFTMFGPSIEGVHESPRITNQWEVDWFLKLFQKK